MIVVQIILFCDQGFNLGAMAFQKSDQSFLRMEFSDDDNVNQKFLRPLSQSMPAKIVIKSDGYKIFRNITVHTQVGFNMANEKRLKEVKSRFLLTSKMHFVCSIFSKFLITCHIQILER